jgi:PAS domain S-box-containing protein
MTSFQPVVVLVTMTIPEIRPQSLTDTAPVAIFCYRINAGRFSYVNPKFAQELGYEREEILALDSVTDIIADDQKEIVNEMIRRRECGDSEELRYVTKVRCRDGSLLDAEVYSSVADIGGERVVIGAAVDMTSHITAHRTLREYEEYFRALAENVSDVVEIVGGDGRLTYVSPSVERVLGYTPEERLGKPPLETIHPEERPMLSAALARLERGAAVGPEEFRLRHKNGTWRVLEIVGTNLLHHPQIRGLVIDLRDVTDRRRMEKELAQLNRLTSLGRLATQVAHEFNNVLMGIQPMIEVIRRRVGIDPELLRITDVIVGSVSRGKRVTGDILRFGKPARPALRLVNVQDVVRQAADEIRPMLPEGIRLELTVDPAPMHANADPAQLAQILINLALNAKDAMQANGGTLTIGVRPALQSDIADADNFIHLTVTDTGDGIAEEDLSYIFEPLFTTKRSGTGLGLSIVFQIATAHGGHVSVDSEPGKGTTFHLFIPLVVAGAQKPDVMKTETAAPSLPFLRVLIVEDEEAIGAGLRWSLEAEGIIVRLVGRGADVMPAIADFRPDLMLLDLSLPDENGQSVYERVSAEHRLPVIFSSGHALENEIEKLLDHSGTAFLMKPYPSDELLTVIRRLITEKRETQ